MTSINLKLLPLKFLLCLLYGALGCIAPFLVIHMFRIGLTLEEVTWINTILPLTSLVGPPIAGYLCDKCGHHRVITICSMLLGAFFYSSLLFVPERILEYQRPKFRCDHEGSSIMIPECFHGCPNLDLDLSISYRIQNCREECSHTSTCHDWSKLPLKGSQPNVSLELPTEAVSSIFPEICINSNNCKTLTSKFFLTVDSNFNNKGQNNGCCEYQFLNGSSSINIYNNITCPQINPECFVICDLDLKTKYSYILDDVGCNLGKGPPISFQSDVTFWLYFFLRMMADMFPCILISLLDALALFMISQHGGDFGRQKLLGLMAVGISAPLVGYLMDLNSAQQGSFNFLPVFYVFDILMVVSAIIALFLPFKVEEISRSSWLSNFAKLLMQKEFVTLLGIVICLGMMWGYLETFLYVYMKSSLNATNFLLGLTATVGIFPSIPFLYNSEYIVKVCGHHYLLIMGFIIYCIRFICMAYITDPYWYLPFEAMELFTLNLANVASALLAFKLAPKSLVCTAQGLIFLAHFAVGRCFGTVFGGYLTKLLGTVGVFKICAIFCAIFAAVYLLLHYIFRKNKARSNRFDQAVQEKPNGNIPNGTGQLYVPLAEKPLEDE